jgi:hypothetical protein
VLPVKYELSSYTPENGILYSHRREHLRSYIGNTKFRKLDLFLSSGERKETPHLNFFERERSSD